MRGGLRGFLAGTLAIAATQAILSSRGASTRLGSLAVAFGTIVDRVMSPDVAAIPDLRDGLHAAGKAIGGAGTAVLPPSQFPKLPKGSRPPRNPAPVIAPPALHSTKAKHPKPITKLSA